MPYRKGENPFLEIDFTIFTIFFIILMFKENL